MNSNYSLFGLVPFSFYALIGLIVGILLYTQPFFNNGCIIGGIVIFLLCVFYKHVFNHYGLIFITFIIIGGVRSYVQAKKFHEFSFEMLTQPVSITGTISAINPTAHNRYNQCITMDIYHPVVLDSMKVHLYTKKNDGIDIGDTITIHDIYLKKPKKPSYQQYLRKEGILTSIFLEKINFTPIHRPHTSIKKRVYHYQQTILCALHKKCSYKTFSLFSALFLGEKTYGKCYLKTVSNQFKEWGIVHFLARSGLHLVIFILLWELFLALIPILFIYKQCALLSITFIYFFLSWPSISFLRAFIIFIIYKWCALNYKPVHFLHTLIQTCCIVLILNPLQLFFLDFQLTFTLTGALALLSLQTRTQLS